MTVLDDILVGVRADLAERQLTTSLDDLKERCAAVPAARQVHLRGDEVRIISEVKRSSPSKGRLADIPDPAHLAASYEAGGAAAISVLTERHRFGGSLADLDAVREAVDAPILRKDFVVDPYQVWEARAHGADIVLLMVVCLDDKLLVELRELTEHLGMTALVEAHTADEVRRGVDAGASVLGINARNLKTLEVDTSTFAPFASLVPDNVVRVAESGVGSVADVVDYWNAGADAVLMGEVLVTSGDPEENLRAMIAATRKEK